MTTSRDSLDGLIEELFSGELYDETSGAWIKVRSQKHIDKAKQAIHQWALDREDLEFAKGMLKAYTFSKDYPEKISQWIRETEEIVAELEAKLKGGIDE